MGIDNTVWAIGGLGSDIGDRVQVLDVDADTWSEKARLPITLGSAAAVVIKRMIYVCGGMIDSGTPGDGSCFRYHHMLAFCVLSVFVTDMLDTI